MLRNRVTLTVVTVIFVLNIAHSGRARAEDKLLAEAVNFTGTGTITYLSIKVPGFILVAVRNGEMAFAGFGGVTDKGGQAA